MGARSLQNFFAAEHTWPGAVLVAVVVVSRSFQLK